MHILLYGFLYLGCVSLLNLFISSFSILERQNMDYRLKAEQKGSPLPKEYIPPSNWRSVVLASIGTLFIVLLFNFIAAWYLSHFSPNTGYLLIRAKWNIIGELKQHVDMLILGDSSGNQGVDPEVIKDELGMYSVNLCSIGQVGIINDALMLQSYLNNQKAPRAVLLVHAYDVWSREINLAALSQISCKWLHKDPILNLNLNQKISLYLNRYFPIYSQSSSLSQILKKPWLGFSRNLELQPNGFMRRLEANPDEVIKDTKMSMAFIHRNLQPVSLPNRKALIKIGNLAEEYKFDVFIINSPLYEGLYSNKNFQRYFKDVMNEIDNIIKTNKRLHHILCTPITFSKEEMETVDHLTLGAAKIYTTRVIEKIRNILITNKIQD